MTQPVAPEGRTHGFWERARAHGHCGRRKRRSWASRGSSALRFTMSCRIRAAAGRCWPRCAPDISARRCTDRTDSGRTWKESERPPSFRTKEEYADSAPRGGRRRGAQGLTLDHVFFLAPGSRDPAGVWFAGVESDRALQERGRRSDLGWRRGFNDSPDSRQVVLQLRSRHAGWPEVSLRAGGSRQPKAHASSAFPAAACFSPTIKAALGVP